MFKDAAYFCRQLAVSLAAAVLCAAAHAQNSLIQPPKSVKILPVFLVPLGQSGPTELQKTKLMDHLIWSQSYYRSQLGQDVTFELAQSEPVVLMGSGDLSYYQSQPEGGAPTYLAELLNAQGFTRLNCPYIYFVVLANPHTDFPVGGGRPINGGYNTGGGIVMMSLWALNNAPNFQSTMRHELGHSFGLPHVDVYGFDMSSSASVMSYNPGHHTNGFNEAALIPRLVPEDRRGLGMNSRALGGFYFRPREDLPQNYSLAPRPIPLGPMMIPGHPYKAAAVTSSGEAIGSSASNITQNFILPSIADGRILFDPGQMWHPDVPPSEWVSVDLTFPYVSTFDQISVYTQHSGLYHKSEEVKVFYKNSSGDWVQIAQHPTPENSLSFMFPATTSSEWRLEFRAKAEPETTVVVRGVRFYYQGIERYPTLVPEIPTEDDHRHGPKANGRQSLKPGKLRPFVAPAYPCACYTPAADARSRP